MPLIFGTQPFGHSVTIWIWLVVVIYDVLGGCVDVVSPGPKPGKSGNILHPHDKGSKGIVGRGFFQVALGKTKSRGPCVCQQWLFQILNLSISSFVEMLKWQPYESNINDTVYKVAEESILTGTLLS